MFRHGGVGFQHVEKINVIATGVLGFPRFHRVALDEIVSRLARQAFFDEREQDGLRIPHAEREAEIFFHVRGIHDEAVHQAREQAEHVVEQRAGIWKNNPLDR